MDDFQRKSFNKYPLTDTPREPDRFVNTTITDTADFNNLQDITTKIEKTTTQFIQDIEDFLTNNQH